MNKQKLMLDLDNCVFNFAKGFTEWVVKNYPELPTPNLNDYDMGLTKEFWKVVLDFWNQGGLSNLEFLPGAEEGVKKLNEHFDVHIVTAVNPKYREDRIKNLNGLPYKSLVLEYNGKADWVINILKPDIAIDDKPKNIELFANAGIDTYYPIWHYNKDSKFGTGYKDWKELINTLIKGNK